MEFDDAGTVVEGFQDTPFGVLHIKKKLRGGFFCEKRFRFQFIIITFALFSLVMIIVQI